MILNVSYLSLSLFLPLSIFFSDSLNATKLYKECFLGTKEIVQGLRVMPDQVGSTSGTTVHHGVALETPEHYRVGSTAGPKEHHILRFFH